MDSLITLYDAGETKFMSNGIGTLPDAISCIVNEQRNGVFDLEMEYPVSGARFDDIQVNRIIFCRPNPVSSRQAFRIYNITKNMEGSVMVYAEHISYQLNHIMCLPTTASSVDDLFDKWNNDIWSEQDTPTPLSGRTLIPQECPFVFSVDGIGQGTVKTSGALKAVYNQREPSSPPGYAGRSLAFEWRVSSTKIQNGVAKSTISWKLIGIGGSTKYGWVYCGPTNLTVRYSGSDHVLVDNQHNIGDPRIMLYTGTATDSGSFEVTHSGTDPMSIQVAFSGVLYWDDPAYPNAVLRFGDTNYNTFTIPNPFGPSSQGMSADSDTSYIQDEPFSIRECLGGRDGSVLDISKGEYEWDNWRVILHQKRGRDNGVYIRYGKNLTNLEQEQTIETTATAVYPFCKTRDGDEDVYTCLSPGYDEQTNRRTDLVYSSNADRYPFIRALPLDLSSDFDETPSQDALRSLAEEYVSKKGFGDPLVNMAISFEMLSQSAEYSNVRLFEEVRLCDTVHVIFEEIGIQAEATVTSVEYNVLSGKYDNLELGDAKATLAGTIAGTNQAIEESAVAVSTDLQKSLKIAGDQIVNNAGGHVVFDKDEDGKIQQILIMDNEDPGGARNVIWLNSNGIGFSNSGYSTEGLNSAWTIDGKFDAQRIEVVNLLADRIESGILKSRNYSQGVSGFLLNLDDGTLDAPRFEIRITDYTDGIKDMANQVYTNNMDSDDQLNSMRSTFDFTGEGFVVKTSKDGYNTLTSGNGFYIRQGSSNVAAFTVSGLRTASLSLVDFNNNPGTLTIPPFTIKPYDTDDDNNYDSWVITK